MSLRAQLPWGGHYGAPPGPPAPPPPRTDAVGLIGLVLSVLGLMGAILNGFAGLFGACCVLCTLGATVIGILVLVPSVAGVIMGVIGVKRTSEQPQLYTGKGIAIAAIVVGAIATLMAVAEIVLPWLGIACFAASGSTGSP